MPARHFAEHGFNDVQPRAVFGYKDKLESLRMETQEEGVGAWRQAALIRGYLIASVNRERSESRYLWWNCLACSKFVRRPDNDCNRRRGKDRSRRAWPSLNLAPARRG
jgi:hypothetical protein